MAAFFKLVVTIDRFKRPVFLPAESALYVGPVCFDLALNDTDVVSQTVTYCVYARSYNSVKTSESKSWRHRGF